MNMANSDYNEQNFDYNVEFGRRDSGKDNKNSRQRRMNYSRANRSAAMHNGIHRRRNKRFTW